MHVTAMRDKMGAQTARQLCPSAAVLQMVELGIVKEHDTLGIRFIRTV